MSGADVDAPGVILEWDSRFFGKRIGRVRSSCLTAAESKGIIEWGRDQHLDCLYYLADGAKPGAAMEAEKYGFQYMDMRVTLNRDLTRGFPERANTEIRLAREGDLVQLKKMTHENHTISRFFADPHFDPQRSAQMYEIWIENDLRRTNGQLWVRTIQDQAVAYTSVTLQGETAEIGLVGVDSAHRRKGYGAELILWTLQQLSREGVKSVDVVTQGSNIAAQILYQKCGFLTKSIDLWYHKWFQ